MAKKAAAAVPEPPKRRGRPPKQGYLPGMEPPSIEEIETVADELQLLRRQRMELQGQEDKMADALLALMHKHKLRVYEYRGKRVEVAALEKIRVRKTTGDNGEGEE